LSPEHRVVGVTLLPGVLAAGQSALVHLGDFNEDIDPE
jgi:hypothetical protein